MIDHNLINFYTVVVKEKREVKIMSKIINTSEFPTEVLNASVPVLVDFYADWCGPCKMMSPALDKISEEYAGKAKVVKINVDENPEVAQQYGVMSIPNFKFFKGGQVVDEALGAMPATALTNKLDQLL